MMKLLSLPNLAAIFICSLVCCRQQPTKEQVDAQVQNQVEHIIAETIFINLLLRATDETNGEAISSIRGSYVSQDNSSPAKPLLPNPDVLVFDDGIVHASWVKLGVLDKSQGGILLEAEGYQPLVVTPENGEIGKADDNGKINFSSKGAIRTVKLKRSESGSPD